MIDLDTLRKANGYVLAIVDESTGEYKPVSSDVVQVVRCKNCKHRPKKNDDEDCDGWGFGLDFPDSRCPCQCEDGWYNWMPPDDWYCANGERKNDE